MTIWMLTFLLLAAPASGSVVAPPLFAPLPASSVFSGCGCSFADAAAAESVLFSSNYEGAARVMGGPGVAELSATRPDSACDASRLGDRCVLKYRNEQLRVVIKVRAIWVCPDDSESCEVVRLEGQMLGRTAEGEKSVEVRGECGC